jgi:Hepatocellular carcinoma-associated antigen 59
MAYIEENMKIRRGGQQQSAPDVDTSTSTDKGKGSSATISTTTDTAAGAKPVGNAQDDLFDHLDPRYKVECKHGEEGSVTNSLAMLTAIPEVDLGMECVSNTTTLFRLLIIILAHD